MNAVMGMIMIMIMITTKYQYELNIDIYLKICLLFCTPFSDDGCGGSHDGSFCHVCDDHLAVAVAVVAAAVAAAAAAAAAAAVEPAVAFVEGIE